MYLESRHAPANIKRYIPEAKLVVILRHPVDRAYSDYWMLVREGNEMRPFEDTIRESVGDRHDRTRWGHYVRISFYYDKLRRYLSYFDRPRLKICLMDDLIADPAAFFGDICRFLGVDDSIMPDTSVQHNKGGLPRVRWLERCLTSPTVRRLARPFVWRGLRNLAVRIRNTNISIPPPLSPDTRRELCAVFREDVLEVQELIGRDLTHWLE